MLWVLLWLWALLLLLLLLLLCVCSAPIIEEDISVQYIRPSVVEKRTAQSNVQFLHTAAHHFDVRIVSRALDALPNRKKKKNQGIAKYHLYNILYRIEREKYMFMITIMIIIIYNLSPPPLIAEFIEWRVDEAQKGRSGNLIFSSSHLFFFPGSQHVVDLTYP